MLKVLLWCKHCGIQYEFQHSGHGCHDQIANDEYCEECNFTIKQALSSIKKKVIEKYIPCPEFGEKFNVELNDKYNWAKQCRCIRSYIEGLWYISIKIKNPETFDRIITVWCSDNTTPLVKAKFDIETDKLLMII